MHAHVFQPRKTLLVLCAAVSFLASARAFGAEGRQKNVAVAAFPGAGGGEARWYVIRVVKQKNRLVPLSKLHKAAQFLGVKLKNREGYVKACTKASIDVVIHGRVMRRRGRWWLYIGVKDGGTGKTVRSSLIRLRGPRMDAGARWSARRVVLLGIEKAEGTEKIAKARPDDEEKKPPVPEPKPKKKRKKHERPAYLTIVEGGIVLEVVGRRFDITPVVPPATPNDPNPSYRTESVIPAIGFHVEAFPGAAFTRHIAGANFGLGIYWARAFGITSHSEDGTEEFDTVYQHFDFFLTYRWNIFRKLKSPELKFDLGIGNMRFLFGVPTSYPDSEVRNRIISLGVKFWYVMFPRIRARIPVIENRMGILFQLAVMAPFQKGPNTEWWSYGDASAWGIDLMAGVDIRVYWNLYLSFLGRYSHFSLKYKQTGAPGENHTYYADAGKDHYFGVNMLISIKY